jgi:hypothetical protein
MSSTPAPRLGSGRAESSTPSASAQPWSEHSRGKSFAIGDQSGLSPPATQQRHDFQVVAHRVRHRHRTMKPGMASCATVIAGLENRPP